MKILLGILFLFSSTLLMAHPNGTYAIDNQEDVTVTFEYLNGCPNIEGAMRGGLRLLSFSEQAELEPYAFVSTYYVETHQGQLEVYVETDENCVAVEDGQAITASRGTFGDFSLRRLR